MKANDQLQAVLESENPIGLTSQLREGATQEIPIEWVMEDPGARALYEALPIGNWKVAKIDYETKTVYFEHLEEK